MKIIDLTHAISEETIPYPGKTPFSRIVCDNYENGYCAHDYHFCSGIGTHMDAPSHFYKDKNEIDMIPLEQCHSHACVLQLAGKIGENADYVISADDIEEWERAHGTIPEGAHVLANTGWGNNPNQSKDGQCHFPGYSEEAAKLLVSRKVKGVGIDTLSIDVGIADEFLAHFVLLKENIFLIENLANLDQLPPTGAEVWLVPMKIKGAPEAPIRAFSVIR